MLIEIFGQGTAHTGPALIPAEVLIAIHDINPEKDNVALKKVITFYTVVLVMSLSSDIVIHKWHAFVKMCLIYVYLIVMNFFSC
jgi:hypothetical protein